MNPPNIFFKAHIADYTSQTSPTNITDQVSIHIIYPQLLQISYANIFPAYVNHISYLDHILSTSKKFHASDFHSVSKFPTAVCFWVSISGSRGLVPGMRSELRGCAGFRDLSPGFRDLSPGFRDFWNLVSHHCVSFYGPSGFRGFIRVPGFLDFCFPSLCFFWFGTCFPGSGTFGTLSPIIVFVLWSIRARDFIRVPGFLDFCLPSLCFFLWFIRAPGFLEPCLPSLCLFCGPSGRGTSSGFRDSWTFVSHHCVFSCGLSGLRDFWNLVSHHCVCSVVHQGAGLHQGSGILGLLFPIIVFLLVPGLVSRVPGLVSRVPGLVEPCLPSLCFFLWFMRAPGFLEIPNSRACWVSISRAGAGSRGLAAFKIRNGTLELEPWNPGTLEPWNPGTLEPWNPGTLEP